jgi:hypothetical protein
MEQEARQYGYDIFTREATGSPREVGDYRIISYPFGRYEIKIKVTPNNEFVEIVEVAINKDFLAQKQKLSLQGSHDVDKFYVEQ